MTTLNSCKLLPVVSVRDLDSAVEVAKKLRDFQERRVFVVNSKHFPIGIISLVDINDRVVAKGRDLKKTKAKDFMSSPIKLVLESKETLENSKEKMILYENFYCPVVSKGKLKGVINYSILIDALSKNKNGKGFRRKVHR